MENIGILKLRAHRDNNNRTQEKKGNCIVCKEPNACRHHVTYIKPYKIIWLCQRHHTRLHYLLKNQNALVSFMHRAFIEHNNLQRLQNQIKAP
jgi:hypothetical protein